MKKNTRRHLLQAAALLTATSLFTACGGGAASSAASSTAAESTASSAAEEAPAAEETTVDRSQPLVVYSNSTQNGQDEWLYDAAAEAGFTNLEIVSLDAGTLTDRLVSEKDSRVCDVVFGLNSVEYSKLKKQDMLVQYTPEWADKVDQTIGDKDGYYWPIIVQPLVMVYNQDNCTNPPKDWVDVATNPEYAGKYEVLALTGGTSKSIFSSIIVRYADPNGDLGISDEGWEIARQFVQNGHITTNDEDWVGALCDGTYDIGELWGAGVIRYNAERNIDFGIVCPDYGVPYVVEQMGIIKGCENQALAEDFINWFGSAETMTGWSQSVGATPANEDALANASDEIKALMAKVHAQDMDWDLVAEYQDQWMEKVNLEYVNQ